MLAQVITILGLLINTTVVNNINDPMITDGEIRIPSIVRVNGGVTESSADSFAKAMYEAQQTGQPVIPIVISSYGGSVYSLFKMVDIINKIKKDTPVATIVIGKAMSAGAVLLSCGTDNMRWISPNATIMIHEVSSQISGKTGEVKADADETSRLNELLLGIMSKNIGKKRSYLRDIIHSHGHADWYLTPDEAVRHNIVNHIGIPKFEISATVKIILK